MGDLLYNLVRSGMEILRVCQVGEVDHYQKGWEEKEIESLLWFLGQIVLIPELSKSSQSQ